MDHVLADGRQLVRKEIIQHRDDFFVAFHIFVPFRPDYIWYCAKMHKISANP
jgi:hypothetical protein